MVRVCGNLLNKLCGVFFLNTPWLKAKFYVVEVDSW